jgi:hypothetical protein
MKATSPAFIVILMGLTLFVYGGWALFRRPKDRCGLERPLDADL